MGKINLKQLLKEKDGKTAGTKIPCLVIDKQTDEFVKKEEGGYSVVLYDNKEMERTLKDVLTDVMIGEPRKEHEQLSKTKKKDRYRIFKSLSDANGSIDLEAEDITILKNALWEQENTLVAGQCCDMLENKDKK